ncbi:MAG: hypothetical protein PGN29_07450 [Gordonia paraffinivorans]
MIRVAQWATGNVAREAVLASHRGLATSRLSPPWTVEHGYRIDVDGDPGVSARNDLSSTAADMADLTPERMRGIGLGITAAPLVNAIPNVCAARPGVASFRDLHTIAAVVAR